jgi:hypothetical protein
MLQQAWVLQQVGYSQLPFSQRGLPPMMQQSEFPGEQDMPLGEMVTVQPPEPSQTELAWHTCRVQL